MNWCHRDSSVWLQTTYIDKYSFVHKNVYLCVCVYLIGEGLAQAIAVLWLHEGVVEECRHVVLLSGKKRVPKHQIWEKKSASFLASKLNYDM